MIARHRPIEKETERPAEKQSGKNKRVARSAKERSTQQRQVVDIRTIYKSNFMRNNNRQTNHEREREREPETDRDREAEEHSECLVQPTRVYSIERRQVVQFQNNKATT